MYNNKRNAFTMIELIFVIVIIGILGAVALPKLNASRYDAKVSRVLTNTKNLIQDIKTFYTSQGKSGYLTASVGLLTNVPLYFNPACSSKNRNALFVGKTMYICEERIPVMKITTTNTGTIVQTITLKQYGDASEQIVQELSRNTTFQKYTNGRIGRKMVISGGKVKR